MYDFQVLLEASVGALRNNNSYGFVQYNLILHTSRQRRNENLA